MENTNKSKSEILLEEKGVAIVHFTSYTAMRNHMKKDARASGITRRKWLMQAFQGALDNKIAAKPELHHNSTPKWIQYHNSVDFKYMVRSKKFRELQVQFRMAKGMKEDISLDAQSASMSMNEWINIAIKYKLFHS